MGRKFWFAFGAINSVVGLSYIVQRPIDETHLCRTVGMAADFSPGAKLINWVGSTYESFQGEPMTHITTENEFNEDQRKKEIALLTKGWTDSPLVAANQQKLLEQETEFEKSFVKAMNDPNSVLSPLGRIITLENYKNILGNRKKIMDYAYDHEELLEGKGIDKDNRMLMIIGMHRTGSTLLQNLLAQDPMARTTFTCEMMNSIPPVKSQAEMRECALPLLAKFGQVTYLCPSWYKEFIKMHNFRADLPEEDIIVLMGILSFWEECYLLRDIDDSLVSKLRNRSAYLCRYLHFFLKLLDSSWSPASHWVLKNPSHSQYLLPFLAEFPEANVIVTHRNPRQVVGSWAKLMTYSHHLQIYNDFAGKLPKRDILTPKGWGLAALAHMAEENDQLLNDRNILKKENADQEKRIFDVSFTRLVTEPELVIKEIYEHFGYDFTPEYEEKLRAYIKNHPKGKLGKVFYSLEEFELDGPQVDTRFASYLEQYSHFF